MGSVGTFIDGRSEQKIIRRRLGSIRWQWRGNRSLKRRSRCSTGFCASSPAHAWPPDRERRSGLCSGNCAPPQASPGCAATRAAPPKLATCSHRSMLVHRGLRHARSERSENAARTRSQRNSPGRELRSSRPDAVSNIRTKAHNCGAVMTVIRLLEFGLRTLSFPGTIRLGSLCQTTSRAIIGLGCCVRDQSESGLMDLKIQSVRRNSTPRSANPVLPLPAQDSHQATAGGFRKQHQDGRWPDRARFAAGAPGDGIYRFVSSASAC
jgi:hypothetical protein